MARLRFAHSVGENITKYWRAVWPTHRDGPSFVSLTLDGVKGLPIPGSGAVDQMIGHIVEHAPNLAPATLPDV